MKRFLKYTLLLISLCFACQLQAQTKSKGDQLFAEGQELQQKKQYKKAIQKYQAAKVAYTTTEKKRMCDVQISMCKPGAATKTVVVEVVKRDTLEVSPKLVFFEGVNDGAVDVTVNASDSCWTFEIPKGLQGENDFVVAEKSETGKGIHITAAANNTTVSRQQSLHVTMKECKDTVTVMQKGKNVTLRTNDNVINYKVKGGSKELEVITNSDSIVVDNNSESWYVESKPDWVEVVIGAESQESLVDMATTSITKIWKKQSKVTLADDEKVTHVNITAIPILKSEPEFKTGRKGEIVFASQNKKHKVTIIQQ